jgi:dipeptidyl aminopeptidase/acylaminoacyl peptidase
LSGKLKNGRMSIRKSAFFIIFLLFLIPASGFPFGKNKVVRDSFDWVVLHSIHFDVHYPRGMEEMGLQSMRVAEEGYRHIAVTMRHEMTSVIPVVVFPSSVSFQENRVIDSLMGDGVGGFTEFYKGRIVVPFSADKDQFRHVLTHEIVHAFEYDLLFSGRTFPLMGLAFSGIPLWVMEGAAEYISSGYERSCDETMRDLICNEKYSGLEDLTRGYVRSMYLFYKEGQFFFYYLETVYGKAALADFMFNLRYGRSLEDALKAVTGKELKDLDREWIHFCKLRYYPVVKGKSFSDDTGILYTRHGEDDSHFNTAPAVSPDGKKIAFLTDQGLYLSVSVLDCSKKKERVLKTIVTGENRAAFESLRIMSNNLSWSRDGNLLCFSAVSFGRQTVYLVSPDNGSVQERIVLPFDEVTSPVISPDGSSVVFAGSIGSRCDLFLVRVKDRAIVRLTDDEKIERTPCFSADGSFVAYSSDTGENASESPIMKVASSGGEAAVLVWGGRNHHPDISADGKTLVYVSDRTGIANLYRLDLAGGKNERLTDALGSLAYPKIFPDGKKIAYVAYHNLGYDILVRKSDAPLPDQSEKNDAALSPVSFLPAYRSYEGMTLSAYSPFLTKDMISGFAGGGIGSGGFVGMALLMGQVSDLLGEHRIGGALEYFGAAGSSGVNAEASYWYLKNRMDFGTGIFMQTSPYGIISLETINEVVNSVYDDTEKMLQYGVYGSASYPFTRFLRLDTKITSSRYEWSYVQKPDVFANLNTVDASLNFDTVAWGYRAPVDGWRGQISAQHAVNLTGRDYVYTACSADVRRYFLLGRDYVFAFRGAAGKIMGPDSADFKYSLGGFTTLRGFGWGEFEGSNMALACAEFRFTFIEGLKFGFPLFFGVGGIGGVLFAEAGSAWDGKFQMYDADGRYKDLHADTGFGFRLSLAPLLSLKLDFAWPYNNKSFGDMNTLFSLGIDY